MPVMRVVSVRVMGMGVIGRAAHTYIFADFEQR